MRNGVAIFDFPYNLSATADSDYYCYGTGTHGSSGFGKAVFSLEYYIGQTDMGRHNGLLGTLIDGIKNYFTCDPTYTRWMPMVFAPGVSTDPIPARQWKPERHLGQCQLYVLASHLSGEKPGCKCVREHLRPVKYWGRHCLPIRRNTRSVLCHFGCQRRSSQF